MDVLNDFSHRMHRKAAGVTSCGTCRDTGYISGTYGSSHGYFGCRYESYKCACCRCLLCGKFADAANGVCISCKSKMEELPPWPTLLNL